MIKLINTRVLLLEGDCSIEVYDELGRRSKVTVILLLNTIRIYNDVIIEVALSSHRKRKFRRFLNLCVNDIKFYSDML